MDAGVKYWLWTGARPVRLTRAQAVAALARRLPVQPRPVRLCTRTDRVFTLAPGGAHADVLVVSRARARFMERS